MKKLTVLSLGLLLAIGLPAQKTSKPSTVKTAVSTNVSVIPANIQGAWMYGNFSMTEYWSTAPRTYLGNALTFAIAYKFKADGTYEEYFTSSVNNYGISTYHQSASKGTFVVDEANKKIITTPLSAHYKRTSFGKTEEDRDLRPNELNKASTYNYTTGTEPSGTKAIYLTIAGTKSTLTFLKNNL